MLRFLVVFVKNSSHGAKQSYGDILHVLSNLPAIENSATIRHQMRLLLRFRSGYVFLVSTLIIGFVVAMTTTTLLLLGGAAEESGEAIVRTNQAFELAQTCADRATQSLRDDPAYAGDETLTYTHGTCRIYTVSSSSNARRLCVEGVSQEIVRRLQLDLTIQWKSSSSPAPNPPTNPPQVGAWNEVTCCQMTGVSSAACSS